MFNSDALCTTILTHTLCSSTFSQTLHKPTFWAHPLSIIATGRPVTIWCDGTQKSKHMCYIESKAQNPGTETKGLQK